MHPKDYKILPLPFEKRIDQLTGREAKNYFKWYMEQIPIRSEYLKQKIIESDLSAEIELGKFPECFITIWRWFLSVAELRKTSAEEQDLMRRTFGVLDERYVLLEVLSEETEGILRDIGMYIGKEFIQHYPHMRWGYFRTPKSLYFLNRPLLIGFIDPFEPIHMAGVQAAKILDGEQKDTDLHNVIMYWISNSITMNPNTKGCLFGDAEDTGTV